MANRPLLERLFATEDFPRLYRSTLQTLVGEFSQEKLFLRIAEYEKAIAPHVGKYRAGQGREGMQMGIEGNRTGFNQAVERQVLAIKPFIIRRNESVTEQLAGKRKGQSLQNRRRR